MDLKEFFEIPPPDPNGPPTVDEMIEQCAAMPIDERELYYAYLEHFGMPLHVLQSFKEVVQAYGELSGVG